MDHISDIKLIRTDTTLDLSQKAEKVFAVVAGLLLTYLIKLSESEPLLHLAVNFSPLTLS
ncbi:hypothetical protein YC2023_120626 [Brassica napus]